MSTDEWRRFVLSRLDEVPIYKLLGIGLVDAGMGSAALVLTVDARHSNVDGAMHGGILSLIADAAMGFAIRSQIEPAWQNRTINLVVDLISGARVGDTVVATAAVDHASPRYRWASALMTIEGGIAIAQARSLNAIRPPSAGG